MSRQQATGATMDVFEATTLYEAWMRRCGPVMEPQLRRKHEVMTQDVFCFLRATFYRWTQLWPQVCADLRSAPTVLAVGDLHVDNFGTWRDAEGRMCWGVNDFDEAYPLPYTNDLVRLGASVKIVIETEQIRIKFKDAIDAILEGYRQTLRGGGRPVVLGEGETILAQLGIDVIPSATKFWQKLQALPVSRPAPSDDVTRIIERALPDPGMRYKVARRQAGIGSLGRRRFVAIANWNGGLIAREVKEMMPSAYVWLEHHTGTRQRFYERTLEGAVRSPDPYQFISGRWLVRRLSPEANPIEMASLPKKRDDETLLYTMGREVANVHLGSRRRIPAVLHDLRRRRGNWLEAAARDMAEATHHDWNTFRR